MENPQRAPPPTLYSLGYRDLNTPAENYGIHVPFFNNDMDQSCPDGNEASQNDANEPDITVPLKITVGSGSIEGTAVPNGDARAAKAKKKRGNTPKAVVVEEPDFSSEAYFGDLFTDLMMPDNMDPFMDDTLFLDAGDGDLNITGISPVISGHAASVVVQGIPSMAAAQAQVQIAAIRMSGKDAVKVTASLVKGTTDDAKKLFVDENWFDGVDLTWTMTGPQTPRIGDRDAGKCATGNSGSKDAHKVSIYIDEADLKLIVGPVPKSVRKAKAIINIIRKSGIMGGPMVPMSDPRSTATPTSGSEPVKRAYRRKGTGALSSDPAEDARLADLMMVELAKQRNRSRTGSGNSIDAAMMGSYIRGGLVRTTSGDMAFPLPLTAKAGKSRGKRAVTGNPAALLSIPPAMFAGGPMGEGYTHPVPGLPHYLPNGAMSVHPPPKYGDGRATPRKHGAISSSRSNNLRYKNPRTLDSLIRTFWRFENLRSCSSERLKVEANYPKGSTSKKGNTHSQCTVAPATPIIFSSTRPEGSFSLYGEDAAVLRAMFPRHCGDVEGESAGASAESTLSITLSAAPTAIGTSALASTQSGGSEPFSNVDRSSGASVETTVISELDTSGVNNENTVKTESNLDVVSTSDVESEGRLKTESIDFINDAISSLAEVLGDSAHEPHTETQDNKEDLEGNSGSSEVIDSEDPGNKPGAALPKIMVPPLPAPSSIGGTTPLGLRQYVSPMLIASRSAEVEESLNMSYSKYHLHSSVVAPEMAAAKAQLDGFKSMCAAAFRTAPPKQIIDWSAISRININDGPLARARITADAVIARKEAFEKVSAAAQVANSAPATTNRDIFDTLKDPKGSLYELDSMSLNPPKPTRVLRASSADPDISSARFLYKSLSSSNKNILSRSMLSRIMPYMTDDSDPFFAVTPHSVRAYDLNHFSGDGSTATDVFAGGNLHGGHGVVEGQQHGFQNASRYKANAMRATAPPTMQGDNGAGAAVGQASKKRSRAKGGAQQSNDAVAANRPMVSLMLSNTTVQPAHLKVTAVANLRPDQLGSRPADLVAATRNHPQSSQMPAGSSGGGALLPTSMMRAVSVDMAGSLQQQQQMRWEAHMKASVLNGASKSGDINRADPTAALNSSHGVILSQGKNKIEYSISGHFAPGTSDQQLSNLDSGDATAKRRRVEQQPTPNTSIGKAGELSVSVHPESKDGSNVSSFKNANSYGDLALSGNGGLLGNLNLIPNMGHSIPAASGADGMSIRSLSTMPHLSMQSPGLNNLLLPSLPPSSASNGMSSWFTPQWPPASSLPAQAIHAAKANSNGTGKPSSTMESLPHSTSQPANGNNSGVVPQSIIASSLSNALGGHLSQQQPSTSSGGYLLSSNQQVQTSNANSAVLPRPPSLNSLNNITQ